MTRAWPAVRIEVILRSKFLIVDNKNLLSLIIGMYGMTMRKTYYLLICVLAMATGMALSGCKARGLTKEEVHRRHYDTIQNNMWQIQDDVDAALLLDRPSRLSEQMVR